MRALQTFSLNVRPELLQQHYDLSHVGTLRNTQAAQAWRKLRARVCKRVLGKRFVGYADQARRTSNRFGQKKRATREPPLLFRIPEW
ncbi:hypothetical protein AB9E19_13590 [Rhizobium leguminosarum]|uniref:hypothetical protein n=1 Tax=Rhizobium leguminosarum TaxID=384 RepID=UPI0013DAE1E4|nr:hypothetical protein [Rhizobium leguminosarum]MBY5423327.1 hypothetical protein [Rhizobium leguminosarum]NEK39147.1 hypothetical protein [Rhizobium leguminosarum]